MHNILLYVSQKAFNLYIFEAVLKCLQNGIHIMTKYFKKRWYEFRNFFCIKNLLL